MVNHAGSVILSEPLDFGEADYLALGEDMNFTGGEATLKHFFEQTHPEKVKKDRNTEEVEAESVSFAVCCYYGIETGENSFGYIASWSDGMELKELRASLETINRTADGLITDIDRNFTEICKERGIDLSNEQVGRVRPPRRFRRRRRNAGSPAGRAVLQGERGAVPLYPTLRHRL